MLPAARRTDARLCPAGPVSRRGCPGPAPPRAQREREEAALDEEFLRNLPYGLSEELRLSWTPQGVYRLEHGDALAATLQAQLGFKKPPAGWRVDQHIEGLFAADAALRAEYEQRAAANCTDVRDKMKADFIAVQASARAAEVRAAPLPAWRSEPAPPVTRRTARRPHARRRQRLQGRPARRAPRAPRSSRARLHS